MEKLSQLVDPRSGFCSKTKTFHSLKPPLLLPPASTTLSAASYAISLQPSYSWLSPESTALINQTTGDTVTYCQFTDRVKSLASSLQVIVGLVKGDTAFVLSPNTTRIPILYFSLLYLGVVIAPSNPAGTETDISHQIAISKPVIAFATSSTCHKLPKLRRGTLLLDSPEFESMMTASTDSCLEIGCPEVSQSDVAAILYSSGTTGKVKGVSLTHRNLIFIVAASHANQPERETPPVILYTVPFFHVYGFFYSVKSVALNETMVVMERFELTKMLRAVEDCRVTNVALAPPVIVAMAKGEHATDGYDLKSLETIGCGGAPLGRDVISVFTAKFPGVRLIQGYGLTESTGSIFRATSPEESLRWGSVGRMLPNCEAKIVDPETGTALPPGQQGELWIRGPNVMKGYAGDPKATSESLTSDGWLRTGDLCYIDHDGFLFVVDRLKELIKYKGYQVPPAELEQLLQSHTDIVDAAVIPYPDEAAGEVPMALVVRHPQSNLDAATVLEYVAKQVAPYKKVRRVAFVSCIPKNAAGKILRQELRKIHVPGSASPSKL